ncbi:ZNF511 [Candida metapsilosis]|uniref:ZNF511 n=1 Tax=Candida metapsilosis TaxID=273372 RepID=A0A8H8DBX6_9ASCO|nr:ZNF511 [Candida metapsilosis]
MGKRSREENSEETAYTTHSPAYPPLECPYCSTIAYGHDGFQNHFLTFHEYQCLTCNKIFPSRYILDLHIDEYHNPFLKLQTGSSERDHGSMLIRCLCESCDIQFTSSQLRIDHLINVHQYPETYPFNITSDGIEGDETTS